MKRILKLIRIYLLRAYAVISSGKLTIDDHILIIAPHPDDEVLGCGGLIQQAITHGKKVTVVILSDGAASHDGCCDATHETIARERRKLTLDTWNLFDGTSAPGLHFLNYPDGQIRQESPETDKLKRLIEEIAPDAIYVPNLHERFPDHLEAQRIILSVVTDPAVSIYEYCVWAWYFDSWGLLGRKGRLCTLSKEQHDCKNRMIGSYMTPVAPCGKPWSGVLPQAMVHANRWSKELFFKIR